MTKIALKTKSKSVERIAFEFYLRTGRHLTLREAPERKFNPYHDPRNGQFTFAPGGPKSIADPIFSDRRGFWRQSQETLAGSQGAVGHPSVLTQPGDNGIDRERPASGSPLDPHAEHSRPNARARIGGNGGPPLDPLAIEQVIPGLRNTPAGGILAIPDSFFDLTGPALYRVRGDARALQVEVLRFAQARVDAAYDESVALFGDLDPRLVRNRAIGNYIDLTVRADLRERFNSYGIDHTAGPVRVQGRVYDSSQTPLTYVIPDAAVATVAFDWTLQRKTVGRKQVRGFFNSDFQPDWTVIIRPSQLGSGHTYIIRTPRR